MPVYLWNYDIRASPRVLVIRIVYSVYLFNIVVDNKETQLDYLQGEDQSSYDCESDVNICANSTNRIRGIDGGLVRECDPWGVSRYVLAIHVRRDVRARSLRIGTLDGDR
jgi:hypothetical protein